MVRGRGDSVADKQSCDRKSRSASSVSIHDINIVCIQNTWIQGYRATLTEYIGQGCCSQTLSTQSSKSAEDSVEHLRIQRLECNWDIATLSFTTSTWIYSHFHEPTFKQLQWCSSINS